MGMMDDMLKELDKLSASIREELQLMRPRVLAARDVYAAYVEFVQEHPEHLFVVYPALAGGGHAMLPPSVEAECSAAVLKVLKAKLAKCNKALGKNHE